MQAGLVYDDAAGPMKVFGRVYDLAFRLGRPADVCRYPDRCRRVRGAH
jgi:hypothetical protein